MKQTQSGNFRPWRIYLCGAIVSAALSVGTYALGVRPAIHRRAEQVVRHAELKARKQKAAALAGELHATRSQLTAVNDALRSRSLRLQPASRVIDRIAELTKLTEGSGLTIDEMRPGAVVDGRDYKTVAILVAGNGTYPACATFLHRLREKFPDMAVRSFQTTNNSTSPETPAATYQFDLTWHAAKG